MRVLLATDYYPPPLVGGRDLHVQMLARALASRGHEVEIASLLGLGEPRTDMDGGVPVHRLAGWGHAMRRFYADPAQPFHPTFPDPGLVPKLRALVDRFRPQVVHAHSWIAHSLVPFLPSRQTRLVVTMHEYGSVCAKNTFVYKDGVCDGPQFAKCVACASEQYGAVRATALVAGLAATRGARRKVDRYIAVSEAVAKAAAAVPDPRRPAVVIPGFVDDAAFESCALPRPSFVPDGEYLMFAGAMGPHKGIDVLLEAYAGLESQVSLVIAGLRRHDTPERFPEGVTVVEGVPHEDVLRAWAHAAIALVPSRWPEPLSLVALEAMAAGKPVIASAVGGLPSVIQDGANGYLVPPGDVRALRARIVELMEDPGLRSRMGEAGRTRARRYAADVVVPEIEQVYEDVVTAATSRGH